MLLVFSVPLTAYCSSLETTVVSDLTWLMLKRKERVNVKERALRPVRVACPRPQSWGGPRCPRCVQGWKGPREQAQTPLLH